MTAQDMSKDSRMSGPRESVLRWFVAFTVRFKRQNPDEPGSPFLASRSMESTLSSSPTSSPGSIASVDLLRTGSTNSEHLYEASDVIRRVLYSTKENVQLLHEVLRQGFRLPPRNVTTIRQVLLVYQDWIKLDNSEKPIFMLEPDYPLDAIDAPRSTIPYNDESARPSSPGRTWSYSCAVDKEQEKRVFTLPREEVRAGLQANLRLFLLHSSEVFLVPEVSEVLVKQVDICKRVIHLYRSIVLEVAMETKTWEQLLLVLLGGAQHLLSREVPIDKERTLSGQLAGSLLQTLFVTWIRANLKVQVSACLWDKCMDVLSSLTHWEEVITEWNSTLQTLTRVMSRTVYALDLEDLPLVRLSEQKRKKRRHQLEKTTQFTKDSFARLSKMETHSITNQKRDKNSSGSPKLLRDTPDKSVGMSSAPVTPNAQRPSIDGTSSKVYPLEGERKVLQLAPAGGSAFKRTDKKLSLDDSVRGKLYTGVVAGPATPKENDSAGQVSSSINLSHNTDSKTLIDSKRDSPLPSKLSFQASDTESTGSGDLSFKPDTEDIVNGIKDEDKVDFASTPPLLRQTSDASTITRQDSTKSLEWCNLSFDKETSNTPAIAITDITNITNMGLSRISESSLESKSDSRDSLVDSSSIPVLFSEDGNEINRAADDGAESDNKRSRFSSVLSGQDTCISDVLGQGYRSPSPPLTDSHEGLLDMDESSGGISEEDQCVIAGGMREGWGPASSVVLWRRMLGVLGNINKISNPAIHAKVIECLATVWNMLAKVRLNQGISLDNKLTPQVPELLPPLQYFATWVFELPRAEAVTLMGSLLSYPNAFPNMPLHQPGHQTNEYQPTSTGKDIKEKLIVALLRVAKLDPSPTARCIALNSLGLFLVEELVHCRGHARVQDCICVLLQSITFYHKAISNVAVDLIHLLSKYYNELSAYEYDLPLKIIEVSLVREDGWMDGWTDGRTDGRMDGWMDGTKEQRMGGREGGWVECRIEGWMDGWDEGTKDGWEGGWVLCHTFVSLLPGGEAAHAQDDNSVVVPLILCLLDWTMAIPVERLLMKKGDDNLSILSRVFQVLQIAVVNKVGQKRRKSLNISTIISGDGRPIRLARVQEESKPSLVHSPFDTPDSGEESQDIKTPVQFSFPPRTESAKLIAKAALMHLVNNLGHFPLVAGPSRLDSFVGEHEDNVSVEADELLPSVFNSPNVQFFSLNDSILITLIELQKEIPSERSVLHDMTTAKTQVRVILRDMTGRHSWDYTLLYGKNDDSGKRTSYPGLLQGLTVEVEQVPSEPQKRLSRKRLLRELRVDNTRLVPDRLDEVLSYIGTTSRECLLYPDQSLNEPAPLSHVISEDMENSVIESVSQQFQAELDYLSDVTDNSLSAAAFRPTSHVDPSSPFQLCRFLISEHGIMTWEKRTRVDLLNRNERFLRELKNLDNRRCRDTHKIAVLYVAYGQEDKTSIMQNNSGSQAYEDFVAGLGWEVDLSKHTGFMGGLERNLSTGATAPYYATSTEEVIFHVSTRMPLATDGTGFTKKMRHLGNDGVHIVWSEHIRDYRYGIVNTEFGDVLIVIYPLNNHLFRIHIIKKPEIPHFGPLFDGAIVNRRVLPSLVRATAVNASKAGRSLIPLYEQCYEERYDSIQTIVKHHKHLSCFEEFASRCFSPAPNTNSRPSTPAVEPKAAMRTHTAPSVLLDQDSRNRSKSTGMSLQNTELGAVN
ncbi:hypothetical protein QZH41_014047, partial [Actinostola sp. cb2023]